MMNVIYNEPAKEFEKNPTAYVGVIKTGRENIIKVLGDDRKEVYDEIYCEWAVIWDYNGHCEVVEASEINIVKD